MYNLSISLDSIEVSAICSWNETPDFRYSWSLSKPDYSYILLEIYRGCKVGIACDAPASRYLCNCDSYVVAWVKLHMYLFTSRYGHTPHISWSCRWISTWNDPSWYVSGQFNFDHTIKQALPNKIPIGTIQTILYLSLATCVSFCAIVYAHVTIYNRVFPTSDLALLLLSYNTRLSGCRGYSIAVHTEDHSHWNIFILQYFNEVLFVSRGRGRHVWCSGFSAPRTSATAFRRAILALQV